MLRKRNMFLQFLTYGIFMSLSQGSPLIGQNVRNALPGELPFIVSIQRRPPSWYSTLIGYRHFCTGTLISRKSVLTAAHCLIRGTPNDFEIIAGSPTLPLGDRYYIKSWITYDCGKETTNNITDSFDNDIAIMTLKGEGVDPKIEPAAILTFDPTDLYKSQIRIAGWGISNEGKKTFILKTAVLKVIANEKCDKIIYNLTGRNGFVPANQFCSIAEPYVVALDGDSGAPILNKRKQVVGVHVGYYPFSENNLIKFKNEERVNSHLHLYYYRDFIRKVIV